MKIRIIGCGNLDRGDDAAGVLVARRLRALGISAMEQNGESLALMDSWRGCEQVLLVDACASGSTPGEVRVWDAVAHPLPENFLPCSTHAFGVREAVELARAMNQLPHKLLIYTIEGAAFVPGSPLSTAVAQAVESVTRQLTELTRAEGA